MKIKNATSKGFIEAAHGDGIDLRYPTSNTRRGRVQKGLSQTLCADSEMGVCIVKEREDKRIKTIGNYYLSNHNASRVVDSSGLAPTVMENHGTITATNTSDERIRKLTPRECWRLQGFSDEAFDKAQSVCSDTQLYKQAGNSITIDVLVAIFGKLFADMEKEQI